MPIRAKRGTRTSCALRGRDALVDKLGGDWNSFVYAADPDRNGRILRERSARDQAIEKGSQRGG
jgi:hypothetical protein